MLEQEGIEINENIEEYKPKQPSVRDDILNHLLHAPPFRKRE